VSIMTCICFVLESGGIDGDTSSFFFRGLIDFAVLDILGFLFGCQVLGDSGGKCCLSVIDVSDSSDWVGAEVPFTWALVLSNLAKVCMIRLVRE